MTSKRDNSGALFKNERKGTENQPGYTGSCMIDGKDFWISAWVQEGAKGKFFSLAFKPKEAAAAKPKQEAFGHSEQREEIPF